MPKNRFQRYLPKPSEIRQNPLLRPVAHLLQRADIWHLNRRTAAGAVFIGLFCAFIPLPAQMLIAAALALLFRCNLPISIALVWITNPLTIPPMFYFSYKLGAWLLDMQLSVDSVDLSFGWLIDNLDTIGYPLIFGSLLCGWVAGLTGFVLTRVTWRFHVITRWRERRARRAAKVQAKRAQTKK